MIAQPQPLEGVTLAPSDLNKAEHGALICYPGNDLKSFRSRINQLEKMGVEHLIFEGSSKVGKYGIIGKGCVSTVVKAKLDGYESIVALKIRRVDANRPDMKHDFELQKFANSFGVGPRAISRSRDLFAMEYIDSVKLGKWCETLKTRTPKRYTRALISDAFEQCYLLDVNGLDHGELSNPTKHVLIRNSLAQNEPKTSIIDYESASVERRVSNLTAVAQFFFLGGWQSLKVRKILGMPLKGNFTGKLIRLLRTYKANPSRESFEDLLSLADLLTKH
ncbi:MAG: serine/threonine protein kinase [Nitrososphaerales archaeon]